MLRRPKHKRSKRQFSNLKILGINSTIVLVMIITLLAWSMFETQVIKQVASVVLSQATKPFYPADPASEPSATYESYPEEGDRIGTITLESLDLSWPIFEGTEEAQLFQGVGHYIGSVLPGVMDNSILSGHRDTVFARLGELEKGDRILIETDAGIFVYVITKFEVVDRSDQTVIQPSEDPILTLTTCYPIAAIGTTTQAYIVTADLVSSDLISQESK
jgi:sortase A